MRIPLFLALLTTAFLLHAQDSGPIAAKDFAFVGPTPAYIHVLKNDRATPSSPPQTGLRIKSISRQPYKGTLAIKGNTIIYTRVQPGSNDSFTYEVMNDAGEVAIGEVGINLWSTVFGSWVLNIPPDSGLPHGRVLLNIAKPGAYTASVTLRNSKIKTRRFSGSTDASGEITLNLGSDGTLTLFVSGQDYGPGDLIPGEFRNTSGETVASLLLSRPVEYDGYHGKYTLAGQGADYGAWAVLQISQSARVDIVGRLSNGMPFSSSAHVTEGNHFNFFYSAPSGSNPGNGRVLSGRVVLQSTPELTVFGEGFLDYGSKQPGAKLGYGKFPVAVSRYVPPAAGVPFFPNGNVKLSVGREGEAPVLESTATLRGDRGLVTAPFQSLAFQRATGPFPSIGGTFRGLVTLPGEVDAKRFNGVIFQRTGLAIGFIEGYRSPGITITAE